ncbi:MAG: glycerophosphodiester phosphodiesterase [Acidimicrobiales bacterium]
MQPRLASLDGSVVTFAQTGATADGEPRSVLAALTAAVAGGASGVASEARLTADGAVVLTDRATIGSRFRRRPVSSATRAELGDGACTLSELYQRLPPSTSVSLELADPSAFDGVMAAARDAGAEERLWLRSPDLDLLVSWRRRTGARLVNTIRLRSLKESPEQRVFGLRDRGVDGLGLHHQEWSGGLVALVHKFGCYAAAWGADHERQLAAVIDVGIDAVSSAHADRLVAVAAQFYPTRGE